MVSFNGTSSAIGGVEIAMFYGLNSPNPSLEIGSSGQQAAIRSVPNVTAYLYMNAGDALNIFADVITGGSQDLLNNVATFARIN